MPATKLLGLLAALLLLAACASNDPARLAQRYQVQAQVVQGQPFRHQVFHSDGVGNYLHVYIEGDGRPWQTRNRVSRDPTGEPLMLELMAADTAPALYLGRPCYFRLDDTSCNYQWWTLRRYAPEVVQSMNMALDQTAPQGRPLVLIGHSGGGALAVLMAAQRDDVVALVTLAGNLDTAAWARLHDYTPLEGSLNPAEQVPLSEDILQVHLVGEDDSVIPPQLLQQALQGEQQATLRVLPAVDHDCCWRQLWPQLPREVDARLARTLP